MLIIATIFSCSNKENFLITNTSIGNYKLNEVLYDTYDTEIFDINLNAKNKIKSIITSSNRFKSKEGLGVGSNFEDIKILNENTHRGNISLSKNNITIGSLGKIINYNDILFIDNNKDNVVDLVWISQENNE